jgi:hypothetical protein
VAVALTTYLPIVALAVAVTLTFWGVSNRLEKTIVSA